MEGEVAVLAAVAAGAAVEVEVGASRRVRRVRRTRRVRRVVQAVGTPI